MFFLYLQLTRKADITDKVSPINLPRSLAKVKPGMMCSVAGWGRLGVNMPSTDKLQEVDLEVQNKKNVRIASKPTMPPYRYVLEIQARGRVLSW